MYRPGLEADIPPYEALLLEKVLALKADCDAHAHLARYVSPQLQEAVQKYRDTNLQRPMIVALFGGTGVGKSTLFNSLLNSPEISPTSSSVRCFTQQAIVAIHPKDLPLVEVPAGVTHTVVHAAEPQIVLVDTPDIDGILSQNPALARKVLDWADLAIYVSSPQKYANEAIFQEFSRWRLRKTWLHVLSGADRLSPEEIITLKEQYSRQLYQLEERINPNQLFCLNAQSLWSEEGERFRKEVWRTRSIQERQANRSQAFFGYLLTAWESQPGEFLRNQKDRLEQAEQQFRDQLERAYQQALQTPAAQTAFRRVIEMSSWQQFGERCGPFLKLPVLLRNRFRSLLAGYSIQQLFFRGLSLGGIFGAAASSLMAAFGGILPIRAVLERLGRNFSLELESVRQGVRRTLQEEQLEFLLPDDTIRREPAETTEDERLKKQVNAPAVGLPVVGELVQKGFQYLLLKDIPQEMIDQLSGDVEEAGRKNADQASGGILGFFTQAWGNLLPLAMLSWILYRIGLGWWEGIYYPLAFYMTALALLAAAFLIGFLPASFRLGRILTQSHSATRVSLGTSPPGLAPLHKAKQWLSQMTEKLDQLHIQVKKDMKR